MGMAEGPMVSERLDGKLLMPSAVPFAVVCTAVRHRGNKVSQYSE